MEKDLAILVGQRVRRLREREGVSLRGQAKLVGISPAALSNLENGHGGMSLTTLQRVGEHFGLAITELLAPPPERDGSPDGDSVPSEIFEGLASMQTSMKRRTGALYQLLGGGRGHLLQPYALSFLPGGGDSAERMAHPGEEFAYVVLGEVELLLGDDVHHLRQGDAIRFSADIPHSFRNTSSAGIAQIVGVATPPW